MAKPIDSHQWASKMEILRLLSAKSESETKADTEQTNPETSESGDGPDSDSSESHVGSPSPP